MKRALPHEVVDYPINVPAEREEFRIGMGRALRTLIEEDGNDAAVRGAWAGVCLMSRWLEASRAAPPQYMQGWSDAFAVLRHFLDDKNP